MGAGPEGELSPGSNIPFLQIGGTILAILEIPAERWSLPVIRFFFLIGSILGLLGVGLGAFAAHGLKERLPAEMLAIFEVGVRYQMYHALALLGVAWAAGRWPGGLTTAAGWLFITGTLIFSGSLYVLALSGLRWLGAVTPLGGTALLAGWFLLILAAWRAD